MIRLEVEAAKAKQPGNSRLEFKAIRNRRLICACAMHNVGGILIELSQFGQQRTVEMTTQFS